MFARPALLLKLDYTILFLIALAIYHHLLFSWMLFAILFFAPDLFMLGYLANPRLGSAAYNLGHSLLLPFALLVIASSMRRQIFLAVAIIWISHIAFDRLLGYGLKYPTHFKDTHLQRIDSMRQ